MQLLLLICQCTYIQALCLVVIHFASDHCINLIIPLVVCSLLCRGCFAIGTLASRSLDLRFLCTSSSGFKQTPLLPMWRASRSVYGFSTFECQPNCTGKLDVPECGSKFNPSRQKG